MSYTIKKDKKRRRFPVRLLLVLLLLLIITGSGMKFGIIPGGEILFGVDGIIPQQQAEPEPAPAKEVTIEVSEDQVIVDGNLTDWTALEDLIKDAGENDSFLLRDQQAIKETFEQVVELLQQYDRDYTLVE
jgi:biopolymer transport protein ExbD